MNFLRRLFGLHIHEWGPWRITQSFTAESSGHVKIIQCRQCVKCGYQQFDEQVV